MKKHQSIFFIALSITLTALYFILMMILGGCKEKDPCEVETIQEAVELIEACDTCCNTVFVIPKEPRTIKSSDIKDAAITSPKYMNRLHKYSTDPPTEHGDYLTWVNIKITVPGDSAERVRWEVLQFNPEMTKLPKWNTLHIDNGDDEVKVTVLYWTELPPYPSGGFEATSGSLK